jgi:hypothetical protein
MSITLKHRMVIRFITTYPAILGDLSATLLLYIMCSIMNRLYVYIVNLKKIL